jgi:opacity protein-like surface antigen
MLMCIVSGAAFAEEGVYAFADVGQSSYGGISKTAMGVRIGGGYNFIEPIKGLTVGAEVAYADFGSANGVIVLTPVKVHTKGFMAAGVANWKIPNVEGLDVFAKVGMMNATTDATVNVLSYSGTSSGMFKGIGVKYDFNQHLAVRAQYEDFGSAVSYSVYSDSLTRISAGAVYSF